MGDVDKSTSSHKYRFVAKKGAGAFSDVIKAQCVKTEEYVAIKRMKATFKSVEQITALREIQALRKLADQPFTIRLIEILFDRNTGRLALVFELMEMNLYELIKGRKYHLPEASIKWYMWQLLHAVRIAHANGTFHRDIKPENILLDDRDNLKLSDFGSCRGIHTAYPYTEYISTRWYRSPECLLTDGIYGPEMDLFGVGCVMFEITALFPLFPGKDELDQINRIHAVIGTPSKEVLQRIRKGAVNNPIKAEFPPQRGSGIAKLIPHASPAAVDLMTRLMEYDPQRRVSAEDALKHPFFADIMDIVQTKIPTMPRGYADKLGISVGGRPDHAVEDAVGAGKAAGKDEGHVITEETRSRQLNKRPQKTPPGAKRVAPPKQNAPAEAEALPKLPTITRTPPARTNPGLTSVVIQGSSSAQNKLNQPAKSSSKPSQHAKTKSGTNSPQSYELALPSLGTKTYKSFKSGTTSPLRDPQRRR